MSHFKVWVRPLGNACKICVEGRDNAESLRERLQQEGTNCTAPEPRTETDAAQTPLWVFRAQYTPTITESQLPLFLESLPDIELMLEPA